MELLVIAEKASPEITRQHMGKVLNYVNAIEGCFSSVHYLSAFDSKIVDLIDLPAKWKLYQLDFDHNATGYSRLVKHMLYLWKLFFAARRILKETPEIQIVTHAFGHYVTGLIVVFLARITKRYSIVRVTGSPDVGLITVEHRFGKTCARILRLIIYKLEYVALEYANGIISVSPHFLESYPQYKSKTKVIPGLCPVVDDYCQAKPEFLSNKTTTSAVFVGRLVPEKGLDVLFEALSQVSGITCRIVGSGWMKQQLEEQVQKLDLQDRVMFVGQRPREEVVKFISESDVLVLPSHSEYFPNVLIEAGALGKPAIASDVGGVKHIVKNKQTGLLCLPGDVNSLQENLVYFASHKQLWMKWGNNAKAFVCQNFTTPVLKRKGEKFVGEYINQEITNR